MKRNASVTAGILLAASAAVAIAQQLSTAPATVTSQSPLPALIERLASESFAEREAAQRELDKLTWRDRDQLQQLLATASDPEVIARLASRLESLDEHMATNPPPISVELKDATFLEMIRALESATGENLTSPSTSGKGGPNDRFTLSAKDMPYWEVFRALNEQHPMRPGSGSISFNTPANATEVFQTSGSFIIYNVGINRSADATRLGITFVLSLDPRIQFLKWRAPKLRLITDNLGNVLMEHSPVREDWTTNMFQRGWQIGQPFVVTGELGQSITATGDLALLVPVVSERAVIADLDKRLNDPIPLAGHTFSIRRPDPAKLNIERTPDPALPEDRKSETILFRLSDASGKTRVGFIPPETATLSIDPGFQPPLKLEITVPIKTKEVTIPFELKNLPIP